MNRRSRLRCLTGLALLLPVPGALAQTINVPAADAYQQQYKPFDTSHLKDRPYSLLLPKPAYPSTERVQREFVVEYVYDYAFSSYTPQVTLPVVAPALGKRDTPENALIAFYSAMRAGDYDAWLACWDEASQKKFAEEAKTYKHDPAFWKKYFNDVFSVHKTTLLVDRVETQVYVILDTLLTGGTPMRVPTVFHLVNGNWMATNDLTDNPILSRFQPGLAGTLNLVPPIPIDRLDQEDRQAIEAQKKFLEQHTIRNTVIEAGR
jgi:hypothetical protein